MTNRSVPEGLSVTQVFWFALFISLLGPLTLGAFAIIGCRSLGHTILDDKIFELSLLPVSYVLDRRIATQRYWRFSNMVYGGVGAALLVQLIVETGAGDRPARSHAQIFGILLIVPLAEELARAVMLRPLAEKWGMSVGIVVGSVLMALLHESFWPALAQMAVLSTVLVLSDFSLISSIAAHVALNMVAAWHISFRTIERW